MEQVTKQAWSSWLTNPLPFGEAQDIAVLLQQLTASRLILLQSLSTPTLAKVKALLSSEPARDQAVEAMKIRVLLWATSWMAATEEATEFDAPSQYQAILTRFRRWWETTHSGDRLASSSQQNNQSLASFSALAFDLLAPLLTLETDVVEKLWQPVQALIQQCWPQQSIKADPFTFHHYLALLDQAGWKAQRRPTLAACASSLASYAAGGSIPVWR